MSKEPQLPITSLFQETSKALLIFLNVEQGAIVRSFNDQQELAMKVNWAILQKEPMAGEKMFLVDFHHSRLPNLFLETMFFCSFYVWYIIIVFLILD